MLLLLTLHRGSAYSKSKALRSDGNVRTTMKPSTLSRRAYNINQLPFIVAHISQPILLNLTVFTAWPSQLSGRGFLRVDSI